MCCYVTDPLKKNIFLANDVCKAAAGSFPNTLGAHRHKSLEAAGTFEAKHKEEVRNIIGLASIGGTPPNADCF